MVKHADTAIFGRILSSISSIQSLARDISLPGLVVFFHVCERDGIGIKELIFLSGFSESLVSRAVDRLTRGKKENDPGLVTIVQHAQDRRRRFVYLTEKGRALRDDLVNALAPGGPH